MLISNQAVRLLALYIDVMPQSVPLLSDFGPAGYPPTSDAIKELPWEIGIERETVEMRVGHILAQATAVLDERGGSEDIL